MTPDRGVIKIQSKKWNKFQTILNDLIVDILEFVKYFTFKIKIGQNLCQNNWSLFCVFFGIAIL